MIQTLCSTVVYPQGFKILCSSSSVGPALAGYVTTYVASSGYVPTFESQYQNQMSGLPGRITPTLGFSEQVAPFNFGSNTHHTAMVMGNSDLGSSSTRSALPNVQIDNSVMLDEMLNGGGTSGNLPEGGTVNQQPVGDQVINEFLVEQARSRMEQVVI